jgi:hypothetical protein
MGSGASQKLDQGLKCPSSYDPEDFQAICTLFDSFDTNGDFVVSGSELGSIASVHVQNKIIKSRRKVDKLMTKQDAIKQQSKVRLEVEINAITREIESSVNRDLTLIGNRIETLKQDIACWEIATPEQKHDCFVEVISKDERVSFPEFFKYMRYRVQDMKKHYT